MTPENQINIAMASDSRFAPGMLVTAGSLALHARLGSRLRLTILDCGLTEKDRADLRSLILRIRPDTTIEFIHPDLSRFASLPTWTCSMRLDVWRSIGGMQILLRRERQVLYEIEVAA